MKTINNSDTKMISGGCNDINCPNKKAKPAIEIDDKDTLSQPVEMTQIPQFVE
jgi:hypothetical protein